MYSPNVGNVCTIMPIDAVWWPPVISVGREVKCLLEHANEKNIATFPGAVGRGGGGGEGVPRSQQTATSTSVNQMFTLIMFLTKTHSNTVDRTGSTRLFSLCSDVLIMHLKFLGRSN